MPLQIRRGTNTQRTAMTQPLAQGELLYVTDDQRLYIGNGSTLGGVQITGYTNEDAQGAVAQVRIGNSVVPSFEGGGLAAADFTTSNAEFGRVLGSALQNAGYPAAADPAGINHAMVLVILTVLVVYVTMVYGPIAAWLVDLFPARIR